MNKEDFLSSLNYKPTIQEIASLFAEKQKKKISKQIKEIVTNNFFVDFEKSYYAKIKESAFNLFKESEYFDAYKLLFGSEEDITHRIYYSSRTKGEFIPLKFLENELGNSVFSGRKIYPLFLGLPSLSLLSSYKKEIFFIDLKKNLSVVEIFGKDIDGYIEMISRLGKLHIEQRKDWEKIYHHQLLQKLIVNSFNIDDYQVPELPELIINS